MIANSNQNRLDWTVGRKVALILDRDGRVRIEDSRWWFGRPAQRINPWRIGWPIELPVISELKPYIRSGLDKRMKKKLDETTDQEDKFVKTGAREDTRFDRAVVVDNLKNQDIKKSNRWLCYIIFINLNKGIYIYFIIS